MRSSKQIRLTTAEMAYLWAQYVSDSASRCMLLYFMEVVEDKEVKDGFRSNV
ncbi:DUF3231 family protein [Alkalihalophilus pseudofirmus]|uniref:DUF3231 family protein n=1 Tax=Alkalihalophilus pseudofirmus TaxID=79885 RepID=UPI00259B3CBC|nr:DUF3231 family protein [Alkalihalophilus pseudofirmus]WEG17853.1 DUF3231 family protein [Alkalihalophilus pseudofirmus]